MQEMIAVSGGCHCGSVRFQAEVVPKIESSRCNCSICRMCGFQHLIIPASRFTLVSGEQSLSEYRFGTGTACHLFCSICGIKSFYVPRSNPDGFSLNVRCLELPADCQVSLVEFDGRNWSGNAAALRHLSREE